jgi:peptide/nickel transport system permease protein
VSGLLGFLATSRLALYGAVLLALLLAAVAIGPWVIEAEPTRMSILERLQPPSAAHPLGTDAFGRDVLSRVVHGGRLTLGIGLGIVALAFAAGVAWGMVSGFAGGWVDVAMMRVVDGLLSFPTLVLAIALAAALGPSLQNAMLAVAIALAPQFARVARSQALGIAGRPFVEAADVLGLARWRILVFHVAPNALPPLLVQASLALASAILQTASLGFLGLGAQPPLPEWGADVSANLQFVRESPWVALAPGAAIFLSVLAFNLIGDGLADWLNPRRRRA